MLRSRLDHLLHLVHTCTEGALATHSAAAPGFPFASHLPFAPDEGHCPVFLISRLAEHTQNLLADGRCSLLLWRAGEGGEVMRATLIGRASPFDAGPAIVRRYLRYQPMAERLLQFGDFAFFRLQPERVRVIGGFAQAGWLDGERLRDLPTVAAGDEGRLIEVAAGTLPEETEILGIDAFGVDVVRRGQRQRLAFKGGPLAAEAVGPAVAAALSAGV